jgi:hypothetical protein
VAKDNAFAMQPAAACNMDDNGMVTKAEYLKIMEMKREKMAKGARELSVANAAIRLYGHQQGLELRRPILSSQ